MNLSGIVRVGAQACGLGFHVNNLRSTRRARSGEVLSKWHRKNKVIFVHIPKSAGSSIRAAIGDPTPHGFQHTSAAAFRKIDGALFRSAYKFSIVRNPIERFVSAYNHVLKYNLGHHDPLLLNVKNIGDPDYFTRNFRTSPLYRSVVMQSLHFQPQWHFICGANGNRIVDDIFSFNNLSLVEEVMESKLGKPIELQKLNPSPATLNNVDEGLKKTIMDNYERDFEFFENCDSKTR